MVGQGIQQKHGCPVFLHSIISLLFAISNGKIKNIISSYIKRFWKGVGRKAWEDL